MTKRILSFLLAFVTVVTVLPFAPQARAVEGTKFEDVVAAVYDEYAASVYQDDADEAALDQLLEPAIYGDGSTLHFGPSDGMTAALYESALLREFFVTQISKSIALMQDQHKDRLRLKAGLTWYDFQHTYSASYYLDEYFDTVFPSLEFQQPDFEGHRPIYHAITASKKMLSTPNKCDSVFELIIGGAYVDVFLTQQAMTPDSVTYLVSISVSDDFNFDGNYDSIGKKYDTSLAELITSLGKVFNFKEFFWESSAEMTVTVPNACGHDHGGVYRWEKVEGELVNITGEGYKANPVEKKVKSSTNKTTGVTTNYYYYMVEDGVELRHDKPWYVEYQTNANTRFYMGPNSSSAASELPGFFKNANRINTIYVSRHWELNPKAQKPSYTQYTYENQYGLDFVKAGTPKTGKHIYRIENRIAPDGSNSLWLLVDGKEIGELTHYWLYDSYVAKTVDMELEDDWNNGKDFIINYIFNASYYFTTAMNLFYLEIGTGGDFTSTREVEATCTHGAGLGTFCDVCGALSIQGEGPATDHTEQVVPRVAPTCEKEGLSEGIVCSVCGEVLQEQSVLPQIPHTEEVIKGIAATCTQAGLSDGINCAVCHKVLVPQKALPLGKHEEAIIVPAKAPTCTEPGNTAAIGCAHCDKVFLEQSVTPALGHAYADGLCSRCGQLDPAARKAGDADNDGAVTYMDAIIVLRASVGLVTPDAITVKVCNLDGVDGLSYMDAIAILRISVGL